MLFNNEIITHRSKTLYFKKWIEGGIIYMKDIIKHDESRILTLREVQETLTQNPAVTTFEYLAVINALPTQWKTWVQNIANNHVTNATQNNNAAMMWNTKSKVIAEHLNSKIEHAIPSAVSLWQRKLNFTLDSQYWSIPYLVTTETRLRELQWKINHHIYATNILLHKMKVTLNNKCSYCINEVDFLEHFLFSLSKGF